MDIVDRMIIMRGVCRIAETGAGTMIFEGLTAVSAANTEVKDKGEGNK